MLFLPNKSTMTDAIIEESEIFLNIPIVSDVIAVGRVGMLDRIVDVEKADYDGESRYISVFCDYISHRGEQRKRDDISDYIFNDVLCR